MVCNCFGVTEDQIRRAVGENDLSTVEDVTHYTKAGGGCGAACPTIEEILAEALRRAEAQREAKPAAAPTQAHQHAEASSWSQKVIDEEIRPSLQADGGDIELVDVDGDRGVREPARRLRPLPVEPDHPQGAGWRRRLKEVVDAEHPGRGGMSDERPSTSTTTPPPGWPRRCSRRCSPYFSELYGNPSSMHSFGGQVGAQGRGRRGSRWRPCWARRRARSSSPAAAPRATTRPSVPPWRPSRTSATSSPPGSSTRRCSTSPTTW